MSRRCNLILLATLFLGILISAASLWHDVHLLAGLQSGDSFCTINEVFDCDAVTKSDHSTLFGVPISTYGLFFYLSLFLFSLYFYLGKSHNTAWLPVLFFWSICGLIVTLRLAYIAAFVLQKFCLFCAGLYAISLVIFVIAWLGIRAGGFVEAFGLGFKKSVSFFSMGLLPPVAEIRKSTRAKFAILSFLALALFVYQVPLYILRLSIPSASLVDSGSVEKAVSQWEAEPIVDIKVSNASTTEDRDFFHGMEDAPVTIVAFSDFECPFCRDSSYIFRDLVERYPSEVKVVFKNFPLDNKCNRLIQEDFHQYACQAAAMAICAGVQSFEGFWVMHDLIFGIDHITQSELYNLPVQAELNGAAFADCMNSRQVKDKIANDIEQGDKLGVQGTPAVFLNGKRVRNISFQVLDAIIIKIVGEKGPEDVLG